MPARKNDYAQQVAIGERLRALRLKQGLRPEVVAGRLGMSLSNYGRYEGGWNALGATQFHAFADALGVSLRELIVVLYPDLEFGEVASRNAGVRDHFKPEQAARSVGYAVALGASA